MSKFLRFYFLFFGVLDLIALVVSYIVSYTSPVIYFSYFTILSNIIATFVFLAVGFGFKDKLITSLRGPAVLYVSITGVVFWTILSGNHQPFLQLPWMTIVLHLIMPVAALLSWFINPVVYKNNIKTSLSWLSFPLLFVAYTLIRGPIVHWYPYPFLNPNVVSGYIGVAKYVVGICASAFVFSLFLNWIAAERSLRGSKR